MKILSILKIKYRNYFLKVPNREIELTKSGNYIIQIEDDNKIVLEKILCR